MAFIVFWSTLFFLLLDFQLSYGVPGPGPVFLSGETADGVLQRHKRANSDLFEEFREGNLERECIEEKCNLEEAREIFEDDAKTMAFWTAYVDGDQCKSSPCLNGGSCKDQHGYYTCSCPSGFTGINCEIAITRRCDVNNGDCMHFCESMVTFGAKCSCAKGYKLMQDGLKCEPEVEFPCGRTALMEASVVTRSLFGLWNGTLQNTSLTGVNTTTSPSTLNITTTNTSSPATNHTVDSFLKRSLSLDDYPTEEPPHPFKRIVGGEVVIPGEIPWQVALIHRGSGEIFCGGSLLSERWVITAAHCLVEAGGSYFIRVGEHNININEGTEQDYGVLEQHIHPAYNASKSLYNHDIGLLYLQTPVNFTTNVRPICLGPKRFIEALVKESSPATVSGWGRTRFLGLTADSLQKVEVPYANRLECKRSSGPRIEPVMFCAGYYNEDKDACQGDSGGPHTNRFHDTWFLTGIVSWGEECAKQGKYGVYTRVSLYYRWINHVMGLTKLRLAFNVDDPDLED